jgi:hypothetical protein
MQTVKQDVEQLLRGLHSDSIPEDIRCHPRVLNTIKRGRQAIAGGRRCAWKQARAHLD